MTSTWMIRRYAGAPVPERWSKVEQKAITKRSGVVPQLPGVPGATVYDAGGRPVLAISDADEVRPDPKGNGLLSTAELLRPAAAGTSWPAVGRIDHPGIGWTDYRYTDLDGVVRGEGTARDGTGTGWGLWAGAVVRAGDDAWTLDDLIRPETDDERARSARRRFFKSRGMAGRVLGHRFVAADGTEAGRLVWVGDRQPEHHERPYEWRFDWFDEPDDAVFVAATASALRFMAYVGTMLSMS
jgi:hypothetical protein